MEGIPGFFRIYLKAGSAGKVDCFPLFSFAKKVGRNKHHVAMCGGPPGLGFSEVFHPKGQDVEIMRGPGMLVNVNICRRCARLQLYHFINRSNTINYTKLYFFHVWSMSKDDIANYTR